MLKRIQAALTTYWGGMHRYFGLTNLDQRNFGLAVEAYQQALEIDPTYRPARMALAKLLGRELRRPEAAIRELSQLIHQNPKDGEALFARAQYRQELGQFEAAIVDLEGYMAQQSLTKYQESAARQIAYLKAIQSELT